MNILITISLIILPQFIFKSQHLDCTKVHFSIGSKVYGQQQCICDDQHLWKNQQCVSLINYFKDDQVNIQPKKCSIGFYKNSTIQQCQQCKNYMLGCSQCNNSIIVDNQILCQKCLSMFYLKSQKCFYCSEAIQNCFQCLSNTQCLTCIEGFYLNLDKQCKKKPFCKIQNCQLCDIQDSKMCLKCMSAYNISQNNHACQPLQCPSGLKFLGNQCGCDYSQAFDIFSCVSCPQNCIQCFNINTCEICKEGYSLAGQICVSCIDLTWQQHCSQCSGAVCLDCSDGFTLVDKTCLQNQYETSGFYIKNNYYQKCQQGCKSCISQRQCKTCLEGYSIFRSKCYKCNQNCRSCLFDPYKDNSICQQCYPKFALISGGICQLCLDQNCKYCQKKQFCQICINGFKSQKGICVKCADNCVDCHKKGSDQCDVKGCQVGFGTIKFVLNGHYSQKCFQCLIGCNICDQNIFNCQDCADGYYKHYQNNNTICQKCQPNCSKCSNSSFCTECQFGYTIKNHLCKPTCQSLCKLCDQNNFTCLQCYSGYKLIESKCISDLTCNQTLTCISCPAGYSKKQNTCHLCNLKQIKNCIGCSQRDLTLCTRCLKGFYLNNNQCLQCPSNCVSCASLNYCYQAANSYYKQNQSSGIVKKCSQNCKTCVRSSSECTSCKQSFKLQSSYCQSQKIIFYQMTLGGKQLNLNLFQLFYPQFIQNFASKLNIQKNDIRFLKFWTKSQYISFISHITIRNNQKELLTLAQYTSAFSTIGQLSIQNSIVKAIGFTPNQNLKLTYGIWIPLTLIFVSILIIISCLPTTKNIIKKKINQIEQHYWTQQNLQI